ncbi:MAG: hypothetical protein WB809_02645 [Thermoplasmata archaeon]
MPYTPLRHKRKRPYLAVAVVILVVFLLILMLPLPLPFSSTLNATGLGPARAPISSIDCVWLSGSWNSQGGQDAVTLEILSGNGAVVYNNTLGFGTFSFYAPDGPYTAEVFSGMPATVRVSGTDWGPLVPVGLP